MTATRAPSTATLDRAAGFLVGPGAPEISPVTFVGEVLLACWLIVAGRRHQLIETDLGDS